MERFKLMLVFQIGVFGIVLLKCPEVEGQCRMFPNSTQVCMCHCEDNCKHGCQTCDLGWSGSKRLHCQKENILFGKTTTQENSYASSFDSEKAVDGNLDTFSKIQERVHSVWWRVRLKRYHTITDINITMETVSGAEYFVYVTDESLVTNNYSLCTSTKTSTIERRNSVLTCSRALTGKVIEIHAPPHIRLKIYEVGSMSCAFGTHGEDCNSLCPIECHNTCNKVSGQCDQCPVGFSGEFCNVTCSKFCGANGCDKINGRCFQCDHGLWSQDCTRFCPKGCHSFCQRETGHCTDCHSGYIYNGTTCVQCPAGFHGKSCTLSCGSNCNEGLCDPETGRCKSCKVGYFGDFCHKNCSENCLNFSCSATAGHCLHCVIGHHGEQCTRCDRGYFGEGCKNTCSYCKLQVCNNVNGTCFECEKGKYGPFCNQTCPSQCANRTCHQDGECVSCTNGRYGLQCELLCPPLSCSACDKKSGVCLECHLGRYGSECTEYCPSECSHGCLINNGSCKNKTGTTSTPLISNNSKSGKRMQNFLILAGTTILIVFSIVFLAKICKMQKERQISTRASNYYRGISSIIDSSSVNRYHSLVEENPYENVSMDSQAMEASDYANEGACASTNDDLIDKQVVAEKSFKKYGRFVSFDDETPRRQQSRDSANSTPYESIVIKDDSMAVSFTKY